MTRSKAITGQSDVSYDVDPVVREEIDALLIKVEPSQRDAFLNFVLHGTLTSNFRNYVEANSQAKEAIDEAMDLLTRSLAGVIDALQPTEQPASQKITAAVSGHVTNLADTLVRWLDAVTVRTPEERMGVFQRIEQLLNKQPPKGLPDVDYVVEDIRHWPGGAKKSLKASHSKATH